MPSRPMYLYGNTEVVDGVINIEDSHSTCFFAWAEVIVLRTVVQGDSVRKALANPKSIQ